MSLTKLKLKHANLLLYLENDTGLLFNQQTASLYSLTAAAVVIVLMLDEGKSQTQILNQLANNTELDKTELTQFYLQIKSVFTSSNKDISYADGQYPELKALLSNTSAQTSATQLLACKIANSSFSFKGHAELLKDLAEILAPCLQPLNSSDFEVNIEQSNNDYLIYINELLVEQCTDYREVIPLVIDRMQVLAFQKSDYSFCFHGAALATAKGNLLLPGQSGVGKSTLSALLCDSNNHLYSDEMIALDQQLTPCTIGLPIAIKSGSWPVVTKKHPELAKAKIWHRLDGRKLKYLWPTHFAQAQSSRQAQTFLILPNYSNSALPKAKVTYLSIIDTIGQLTNSGYQLGFELSSNKLEEFIDFLQQSSRASITYSHSDQVKTWLDETP
ncbi:hypothetical protein [Paraglaciecola aestuariivivens]